VFIQTYRPGFTRGCAIGLVDDGLSAGVAGDFLGPGNGLGLGVLVVAGALGLGCLDVPAALRIGRHVPILPVAGRRRGDGDLAGSARLTGSGGLSGGAGLARRGLPLLRLVCTRSRVHNQHIQGQLGGAGTIVRSRVTAAVDRLATPRDVRAMLKAPAGGGRHCDGAHLGP